MSFSDIQRAASLLIENPKAPASEFLAIANRLNSVKKEVPHYFRNIRCAFLGSFTLQGLPEVFRARAVSHNLLADVYLAPYNQFSQQIMDNSSDFYKFAADIVFLIIDRRDMLDLQHIYNLIDTLKSASKIKNVVLFNFAGDVSESMNRELEKVFAFNRFVSIFNFNCFLDEVGREDNWYTKYVELGDLRLNPQSFPVLAEKMIGYAVAVSGNTKKCLVVDLDNTLWKGIVGEDGSESLIINSDLQKNIIDLYNKGIILAINSRNNLEDAWDILEKHPGMNLRKRHFAAWRINWNDKHINMKELIQELNISSDSVVFIDDDPFQRNLVREVFPEIAVFHPDQLKNYSGFFSLITTEEDRKRGEMCVQERQRNEFKISFADQNDFLKELGLEALISRADIGNIPRISQLTQKTNQFNLATHRYSEDGIRQFLNSDGKIWAISVRDKFGDYGITGVCMIRPADKVWYIDNFLLSCRVLGRGVESAFLSFVCNLAKAEKIDRIVGTVVPTAKNKPSLSFLSDFGFGFVYSNDSLSVYEEKLIRNYSSLPFIKIRYE